MQRRIRGRASQEKLLMVIARVKPVVVLLENVKQYLTTGSMCILRTQLRDLGYELHETVLQAADWNELEHRDRMCLVAVTRGLACDLNMIERPISRDRRIAEVLDSAVPADRWSPMRGSELLFNGSDDSDPCCLGMPRP